MGEEAMKILDIDHIELYVGDAMAAAQSLCTAYGFRVYGHGGPDTGLPGQRSVLLGQGGIRLLLTSGLHKDHPASQFDARHGDGVGVTAFRTSKAAAAYTGSIAAGGSGVRPPCTWRNEADCVVTAEVAGFGDVVYRFVERRTPPQSYRGGTTPRTPPQSYRGGTTPLTPPQFQPGVIEMEPGAAAPAVADLLPPLLPVRASAPPVRPLAHRP